MIFNFANFEERVREDNSGGMRWIYRGHSLPEWKLETSFLRYCKKQTRPYCLDIFFKLLDVFIDRAVDFLGEDLLRLNLCQQIALAQHHGIPTPFLDWTESPYVAVFFALSERYSKPTNAPFTVWAIKVQDLFSDGSGISREALSHVSKPFRFIRPKVYQSKRLSRQFGVFTFFGNDQGMEDYLNDSGITLKRYDVVGDQWPAILSQLHLMGVSASNLFDNLDGIALDTLIQSKH